MYSFHRSASGRALPTSPSSCPYSSRLLTSTRPFRSPIAPASSLPSHIDTSLTDVFFPRPTLPALPYGLSSSISYLHFLRPQFPFLYCFRFEPTRSSSPWSLLSDVVPYSPASYGSLFLFYNVFLPLLCAAPLPFSKLFAPHHVTSFLTVSLPCLVVLRNFALSNHFRRCHEP